MHAGTLEWNGLDLSTLGKPKLRITRTPDPPAPAFPTRELVSLQVTMDIEALDPGTVQARVEHLQASMGVAEGILRSVTGTGHALEWLASPAGDNLAAVLSGTANTLEMSFQAHENHAEAAVGAITAATFTPAGTSEAITLHAARGVTEDIAPERHSPLAAARRRTTVTIALTARVAQSNPADGLAARLAYLQGRADEMRALDCREGTLVFGGTNAIVRVTEFSPVIDEKRGALDLRLQCQYLVMPAEDTAEMMFEIKDRSEAGNGERVLVFAGTIEAETRDIALAKLTAFRANQTSALRRVVSYETADKQIDGADTDGIPGADWTGALGFTLEVREARTGSHYDLKIRSTRDIRAGMRWSYTGSITGTSELEALALAQAIVPENSHPVRVKAEELIERLTDIGEPDGSGQGAVDFVKLDFSYEFEGPADGFIGGELATDRNLPLFGEYRRVVSGFLVAADREAAETRLALLLAAEGTAIETTRKWTDTYLDDDDADTTDAKRVFQRLEFSSGSREVRTNASCKLTDSTSSDEATMLAQREVTGTIWSDTEAHANAALDELVAALFGTGTSRPQRISKSHQKERWGNATQHSSTTANSAWVQLDFSLGRTAKLTGTIGNDIIEASYTLERTGSINNSVVWPIPFDRPAVQTQTGHLPGRVTLRGTCKARVLATARSWVQGKRAMLNSVGADGMTRHETEQPRESAVPEHAPFSGADVTTWTFSGSYGWTFTGTVLDSLWGSSFAGL